MANSKTFWVKTQRRSHFIVWWALHNWLVSKLKVFCHWHLFKISQIGNSVYGFMLYIYFPLQSCVCNSPRLMSHFISIFSLWTSLINFPSCCKLGRLYLATSFSPSSTTFVLHQLVTLGQCSVVSVLRSVPPVMRHDQNWPLLICKILGCPSRITWKCVWQKLYCVAAVLGCHMVLQGLENVNIKTHSS